MYKPQIDAITHQLPRRGNTFTRCLGKSFLRIFGWSICGEMPDERRLIAVVAPHTSNWDFVFGIAAVFALSLDANWVGKQSLFVAPIAGMMRWLGGIPVDRRKPQGVVEQIIEEFQHREHLLLGITPEGTRSRVDRWKTGFHRIAQQAGVTIVPVYLDYRQKQLVICKPAPLTTDLKTDLATLQRVFSTVTPKFPQKFNPRFY